MDSDNDDSSDNIEIRSLDSDRVEVLEVLADSLEEQICQNVYSYQSHVELIKVLKELCDLNRLRTARKRMAEHFPLSVELWTEWLEDEMNIAATDEEKKMVFDLCERAVKDYLSVEIWLKYLEYAKFVYKHESESKIREVRKICEQSLATAGLHVTKASLLWNSFINYEKGALEKVEHDKDLYFNQLKLVGNLYKRMLSCPLIDIDESYEKFSSWLNEQQEEYKDRIIDRAMVENIYKNSREKLLKIKEFEDALNQVSDSANAIEHYRDYIEHEKSRAGSPVRVRYLYERMIHDFCVHEELWLNYIDYVDSVLKNEDVVMDVIHRSLRNCPWSCRLHQRHLQFLEKFKHDHTEVTGAFEQAVASGLRIPENFRDIWMTYLEYLRRRYDAPDISKEEECRRLEELRTGFEKAVEFLAELDGSDPEYEVALFWGRIEANHCRNIEKCRELWNDVFCFTNFRTSDMWLEYVNIERAFGDSKHVRKLLTRALNCTRDFPEKIAKYWVDFERDEGTLDSYLDSMEKIETKLKEIKEQREREKEKKLAEKQLLRKKSKRSAYKKGKASRGKNLENDANKNQGTKRKLEQSDDDGESPEKRTRVDTDDSDEELVRKLLGDAARTFSLNIDRTCTQDSRTVFVSNLDFATEEPIIQEAFESCGDIVDLRLVRDYKGRSKGYCYVEFAQQSQANEALKRDREMLNGRPMFVSKCEPDSEIRGKVFKYSSGVEKNKLFVRGLPFHVTEIDLKKLFGEYGALKGVRIVTFRNGHSKGLAYIEFEDEGSAGKALLETNGITIGDRQITVVISNPPQRCTPVDKRMPPLGSGPKEFGPRKTSRKQLEFVPRSVQLKTSGPPESVAGPSHASPESAEPPKKLSNTDFRSMLNK